MSAAAAGAASSTALADASRNFLIAMLMTVPNFKRTPAFRRGPGAQCGPTASDKLGFMLTTLWRYPIATVAAIITRHQAPVMVSEDPGQPVSRVLMAGVQPGSGPSRLTLVKDAFG